MPWCHKCQKHPLTPHGAWCHIPFRGMALAPVSKKDSTPSGTTLGGAHYSFFRSWKMTGLFGSG